MAIGSYHINKKFRLSPAPFLILLNKMTNFSPKNHHFFGIKTFWVVREFFFYRNYDHRPTADIGKWLTQTFFSEFL